MTDANDVALYTLDPAPVAQGIGSAASEISFDPTVGLPYANVQAAIEGAATISVAGFAASGLGITGNATLLADIDAVGTGAGVYRFDGTTTGTYPTGVVAGDTGMVELWRQTSAIAMMELHHATSNRVFRRRLTASVWGAWREVVNVNQATMQGDLITRGAADFTRLPKGAASQALYMDSAGVGQEWVDSYRCRAWVNFSMISPTGTYTRSGNTVTVTMTAHGMGTGQYVELNFTSGSATDGYYQITVTDANTFTITDPASGATSGNVTREIWVRSSGNIASVTALNTGYMQVNFTSAMPDAFYAIVATGSKADFASSTARIVTIIADQVTASRFRVVTETNSATLIDLDYINIVIFR